MKRSCRNLNKLGVAYNLLNLTRYNQFSPSTRCEIHCDFYSKPHVPSQCFDWEEPAGTIHHFFLHLQEIGPDFGYFPVPSKSIIVVREHNLLDKAKSAFADLEFQITTGSRYLRDFIGGSRALLARREKNSWTLAR
jgi:hypothetical protein